MRDDDIIYSIVKFPLLKKYAAAIPIAKIKKELREN